MDVILHFLLNSVALGPHGGGGLVAYIKVVEYRPLLSAQM